MSTAPSISRWMSKAPELKYSNIKGKNPLADVRVREALYRAIDIEAIKKSVMRGMSLPDGCHDCTPNQRLL